MQKPFDDAKDTILLTDASRLHGLGYALVEKNRKGELSLIQCGSWSLTPTQQRYATIELRNNADFSKLPNDHPARAYKNIQNRLDRQKRSHAQRQPENRRSQGRAR